MALSTGFLTQHTHRLLGIEGILLLQFTVNSDTDSLPLCIIMVETKIKKFQTEKNCTSFIQGFGQDHKNNLKCEKKP